ncbi:hypothetical protein PMAYCL1PPCAC_06997 [Pristionchus mayeri]|uniref:Uncharacterized protein n=1 Tax=Pristionchus mayeri TaxID=1317129 RepID=A0AAN4Z944_9BILA|nr:hypothetical protein PMAYCL1PPCAC_06997 [Pristionchus mayeri]
MTDISHCCVLIGLLGRGILLFDGCLCCCQLRLQLLDVLSESLVLPLSLALHLAFVIRSQYFESAGANDLRLDNQHRLLCRSSLRRRGLRESVPLDGKGKKKKEEGKDEDRSHSEEESMKKDKESVIAN